MNPWWRRPSAESSPSTSKRTDRPSEDRPRRNSRRSSDDEDRGSGSSRGRRRGRRGGRRSGAQKSAQDSRRNDTKQESGNRKRKPKRVAVLLDMARVQEGFGSCEWQPESPAELIDRALRSTLGEPNGSRIYLRAYAAWSGLEDDQAEQFEEAGVERIDVSDSSTVRMVMDAVERSYGRNPCETFVLVSASDDLAPLAERLRERRRKVLACGFKSQPTPALEEACTSFAFLDDEPKVSEPAEETTEEAATDEAAEETTPAEAPAPVLDPFLLLHRAAEAVAEDGGAVWGSLVRQTMQSMQPGFTELDHGFDSFADMLEEAQRRGIVALERDARSKTYYLSGLATAD